MDIQIEQPLSQDLSEIEKSHEIFKNEFPEKKTRHTIESIFPIAPNAPEVPEHNIMTDGFQFWKSDKTEVIQYRLDGYSYSRLKPYISWEEHSPKMFDAWDKYVERFNPRRVKRIAVRFINLFEIPESAFELKKYFHVTLEPPSGLPQKMSNFLQRLEIDGENGTKAIVMFKSPDHSNPIGYRCISKY